MSSPRKIKHFTEVLDSNPGCETQCEDLPHSAKYPSNGIQKYAIFPKANRALIGAGENEFLWYSSMSPIDHSIENVVSQEGDSEEYHQDISGLFITEVSQVPSSPFSIEDNTTRIQSHMTYVIEPDESS
ncbi:hypothetical protein EV702DRAFT_1050912 [Suillus placidus]|uniref:Uncharacterized protein n=1 Tax=Suillus placidus TaxID=48579 RepID=A0A9P6ZGZ6_9AGAM|nr:hypothetical protein EV702DRAFT_1050912 [Suillus placidus]